MNSLAVDFSPSRHRLSKEKTPILASPWGGEEVEHLSNIPVFQVLPTGPASVWEIPVLESVNQMRKENDNNTTAASFTAKETAQPVHPK